MVSPLAQSDHKRSPGRAGVALVLTLDIEIMMFGEEGAHNAPANKTVKSYFAFFSRPADLSYSDIPPHSDRPGGSAGQEGTRAGDGCGEAVAARASPASA